jgi:hypothetical protein
MIFNEEVTIDIVLYDKYNRMRRIVGERKGRESPVVLTAGKGSALPVPVRFNDHAGGPPAASACCEVSSTFTASAPSG